MPARFPLPCFRNQEFLSSLVSAEWNDAMWNWSDDYRFIEAQIHIFSELKRNSKLPKLKLHLCLYCSDVCMETPGEFVLSRQEVLTGSAAWGLQVCDMAAYMAPFISLPESDSLRSGLKFYPWCFFTFYFFSTHEISEMRGPTGVKFCTMVSNRLYFIMPVQNFGARTPKKFQIVIPSMAIRPALGETSTVKFGPVTLEI